MNLATCDLRVDDETISWRDKGFPPTAEGLAISQFVAAKPSLFEAGFSWPIMTLRESAIANNVGALARWCETYDISLAPHGKTTMAPALFSRQLAAGAWAMTAATPWQVRAYRGFGVPRVLLANELVDAEFVSWLTAERANNEFDFLCYVDSVRGVEILGAATAPHVGGPAGALKVLIELGIPGGRTGTRSIAEAMVVARAVQKFEALSLVGVAGYEGPLGHERDAKTLATVHDFVTRLGELLEALDHEALLAAGIDEYILTCGGSGHVDVVSHAMTRPLRCSRPVRPVLRSGSYITHDDGLYAHTSSMAADLLPAIELWAQVWSRPEPALALVGAGRRDLPFDSGLPIPLWRRSSTGVLSPLQATVTQLNDQHAFVELGPNELLEPGDLVGFGVSHPCTAHDKWQLMPLLDDDRRVIDCVRSYF
ncbi:MAG: hypothetical protein ACRDV3_16420 [Acidothermaceae bacterium]